MWSLDTFWHQDENGTPRAFFRPDPAADWVRTAVQRTGHLPYYWLFDGFVAHDVLFVGLMRVVQSEPRGPFNLPFQLLGMDLARIENYRDVPEDWRVQFSTLSNNTDAFPGSAFVVTRSHLHAFAFFDHGDGRAPRMLSRLNLDALVHWQRDLSNSLEYLGSDGRWQPGFEPDQARIVMDDDASEMSVHFDFLTGVWIAIYNSPRRTDEAPAGGAIQIRTARDLTGPWSKPKGLAPIPEIAPGGPHDTDQNLFCYAAKVHPQFSSPDELVVTYVCNLFARDSTETFTVLERLRESPDLYRPRAIPIPILRNLESMTSSE
jgi:hypothetical protein